MNKGVVIGIVVLVLIVGGFFMFYGGDGAGSNATVEGDDSAGQADSESDKIMLVAQTKQEELSLEFLTCLKNLEDSPVDCPDGDGKCLDGPGSTLCATSFYGAVGLLSDSEKGSDTSIGPVVLCVVQDQRGCGALDTKHGCLPQCWEGYDW